MPSFLPRRNFDPVSLYRWQRSLIAAIILVTAFATLGLVSESASLVAFQVPLSAIALIAFLCGTRAAIVCLGITTIVLAVPFSQQLHSDWLNNSSERIRFLFFLLFSSGAISILHFYRGAARRALAGEERFHDLVDNLDHAIVWEADQKSLEFFFVSQRCTDLLGYSKHEWRAMGPNLWKTIVPEGDQPTLRAMVREAQAGRVPADRCDHRFICKDGSIRWFQTGFNLCNSTSPGSVLYGLSVEITPLKEAQAANEAAMNELSEMSAQLSEKSAAYKRHLAELNAVFESIPEAIYIGNETGIHHANKLALEQLGFDSLEQLNRNATELSKIIQNRDPETGRELKPQEVSFMKALRGEATTQITEVVHLKTGERRLIRGSAAPVIVDDKVVGAVAINLDITEERKSSEQLKKTASELRDFKQALDASSIVAITDKRGVIKYVNDKFCEISKYGRDELIGKTHKIINSGFHSKEFFRELWATISAGRIWSGDIKNRAKDGTYYWVQTFIIPFLDENGKPYQYLAIRTDITKRKETEIELKVAKEAAEFANQSKTYFLANMSHEIRTPLGVIQGYAELLSESNSLDHDERQMLSTITRNTRQLTEIIGEILDVSKIEANKIDVEVMRFPLQDLFEDIKSVLGFKAAQKDIRFCINVDGNTPRYFVSDLTRIKQILLNLGGNAIKFTTQGQVEMRFSCDEVLHAEDVCKILRIEVEDTGIGITPHAQTKLFKPFTQADQSTTRRFGGTGLGLYISKKLAEALGGELNLTSSVPGKGTIFTVTLTNQCDHVSSRSKKSHAHASAKSSRLRGASLLLVEDSPDNQALIKRILSNEGAKVETAANGKLGVEAALSGEFDLVLMDIQMPELDGWEAVSELRKKKYRKPIVALTAHALAEEKARSTEAGFDEYLTKPINRDQMVETIDRLVHA